MTQGYLHPHHLTSLTHYLVALFGSRDDTTRAAERLLGVGFAEGEVIAVHPEHVEELRVPERSGLFRRLWMLLDDSASYQTTSRSSYVEGLTDGESVLLVFCPKDERRMMAHQIVRDAGGFNISYIGQWTTEHMPS